MVIGEAGCVMEGAMALKLQRNGPQAAAWLYAVPTARFTSSEHRAAQYLTRGERAYLAKLGVERRRCSYVLGRYAAKQAVSRFLGGEPLSHIEIDRGVFEQPVVKMSQGASAAVSITHTDTWVAALAFPAGHPMALDLEEADQSRRSVIRSQLNEREIRWIEEFAAGYGETVMLTLLWTAKEALSKVLGCGLTAALTVMGLAELDAQGGGCFRSLYENFGQYQCLSWADPHRVLSITLPRKTLLVASEGE